jgi:hypothetical protein
VSPRSSEALLPIATLEQTARCVVAVCSLAGSGCALKLDTDELGREGCKGNHNEEQALER